VQSRPHQGVQGSLHLDNNDSVIDILDAIAIRDARGTSTRAADINFDGTVGAADGAVEVDVRGPGRRCRRS